MLNSIKITIFDKIIFMKKNFSIFLTFAFFIIFAQNKSFIYEMNYKENAYIDSIKTEITILDVENLKSVFRLEAQKNLDSINDKNGSNLSLQAGLENKFFVTKDLKKNNILKIINNLQDIYSLPINEKILWEISNEKKKIGNFICQKATVNYGGREWEAWFTIDIPIQEGPYIFHGLPGLIIEIYDKDINYQFSLIQIRDLNNKIFFAQKTIKIDWNGFKKLALEYYNDPFKNTKSNSAGINSAIVRYLDEDGNEIKPAFKEWTLQQQKQIKANNNPIELNHKINY